MNRNKSQFNFDIIAEEGYARAGVYHTPHGEILTPVFAPVGTKATVKSLTPAQLSEINASLILANTYHLYLRPGDELVAEMGGLHQFMSWNRPILTDSGGFQVFSLGDRNTISADGVIFQSHIDGSSHQFTPEKAIAIQENLGADIIMAFDECAHPYDKEYNRSAMERTHSWASRSYHAKTRDDQALFGIIQGGVFEDLRLESAEYICSMDFHGIAIGGLSVGESKEDMHRILNVLAPVLPRNKPHYLMGVGTPEDLVQGVIRGIDIFDCVLPTRLARHKAAQNKYGRINLAKSIHKKSSLPLDKDCTCYTCQHFTRSYIRHLILSKELLAPSLISIHNLHTLITLMEDIRNAILKNSFNEFSEDFFARIAAHSSE